jgi:Ni/Fe-hydrogenase 1 B-type cytochrome subunit
MEAEARPIEQVYVWELPVRFTHWLVALSIFVLAATGFYIGDPFIPGSIFLMGWIRTVHLLSAYVLIAALGARAYWAFAGNRFASWRVLLNEFGPQEHKANLFLLHFCLPRSSWRCGT